MKKSETVREHAARETRLKGVPLSDGCVAARVCLFNEKRHSNLPLYRVSGSGAVRETRRAKRAIELASARLEEVRERVAADVGPAEAEIFVAQKMIIEDPKLHDAIMKVVTDEGANAEAAVMRVLDAYEARLSAVDDAYIKDRASDFGEAKRRILDVLANMRPSLQCAGEEHCQRGRNRVIVAEELTPTMTVDLDTEHVMGFATERGGAHSHGAILARALGVPAVSGLPGLRDRVGCGTEILVDGRSGEVIIWPREETVARFCAVRSGGVKMPAPVDPVPGLRVMANIRIAEDVAEAAAMKAEGIGLYRTEIEVIAAGRMFTEEEYAERYLRVLRGMSGAPVTYRLLDIGSDKPLPFVEIPREDNPSLGWRGARFLLGRPDLLRAQARALARVSRHGAINVMYPMIADADQFAALRDAFRAETRDLPQGDIRHGVMLEVPAACLQAKEILDEADFASIGTNDLIQYLYAVDRNNERVAHDYHPDRPALWRLLGEVAAASAQTGKPLSLCGEVGADTRYTARLMEMGITTVSVNTRLIPAVRAAAARRPASGAKAE
ncbi:MAG: phosphoenolpyruvate--protein phosphotransferase [Lentisphaerae bacterium]|nr:phosphoenolpyruvate--protein phosphotransferase [Lentisphaerota bacterium]